MPYCNLFLHMDNIVSKQWDMHCFGLYNGMNKIRDSHSMCLEHQLLILGICAFTRKIYSFRLDASDRFYLSYGKTATDLSHVLRKKKVKCTQKLLFNKNIELALICEYNILNLLFHFKFDFVIYNWIICLSFD